MQSREERTKERAPVYIYLFCPIFIPAIKMSSDKQMGGNLLLSWPYIKKVLIFVCALLHPIYILSHISYYFIVHQFILDGRLFAGSRGHRQFVCLSLSWQECVLAVCKRRGRRTSLLARVPAFVRVRFHMTLRTVLSSSASLTISASLWSRRHSEGGRVGGWRWRWGSVGRGGEGEPIQSSGAHEGNGFHTFSISSLTAVRCGAAGLSRQSCAARRGGGAG